MLPLALLLSATLPVIPPVIAPPAPPPPPRPPLAAWPSAKPGRVTATPDWSDYRIYPPAARARDEEGEVVPEIFIGADGAPTECRILKSSGFVELDAGSCKLMMQMRFEPARDASGAAVASHYMRPLIWVLDDARPFASAMLRARLSIDGGKLTSCEVVGGEGPYVRPWSAMACYLFRDVPHFFGDSANKSLDATIEVRLDAGDGAGFLSGPWPAGNPLAARRISFTVNKDGDATECTPLDNRGFGQRDLNNMSPCGNLLGSIWFAPPVIAGAPRKGVMETRVYALEY